MFYNKKLYRSLHPALSIVLIAAVIFNFLSNNSHQCSEHSTVSSEMSCNEDNELDACHRYLIHHEKSEACNGSHEHLNSSHDDCFVCKYVKERHHEPVTYENGVSLLVNENIEFAITQQRLSDNSVYFSEPRGPPTLS
jgi:hypothetical protein